MTGPQLNPRVKINISSEVRLKVRSLVTRRGYEVVRLALQCSRHTLDELLWEGGVLSKGTYTDVIARLDKL
jgi:hypothetical protein